MSDLLAAESHQARTIGTGTLATGPIVTEPFRP
jgi:hypothetical protein